MAVTVNYTNINPAAQNGEIFATITANEAMMSMWLSDNYSGALTLVMVSPTTYNVVVVDSSALPSTVGLSVQGYSMLMQPIAPNNIDVIIDSSLEAIADIVDTQINEAVTTDVLENDNGASDATVVSISVDPAQGTAVINPDGTVTFAPAQNFLGNAVVTYTIENTDGETSTSTLTITVSDTVAPTQTTTITSIIDDVEFNTGIISDGGYTNDTKPEVQGTISSTLDTNEVVAIYRDGVKVGTATVNGTTWTFQETTMLTDGAHEYTARVEDSAGNLGTDSNEYNLIVDTVAPKQATSISDVIDDVAPVIGTVTNGGTTNDTAPLVEGTISFTLGAEEKIVVLRDGVEIGIATVNGTTWSFADSSLADGKTYTYTARVEDAAGNRGAISTGYEITIDSSVPTQNVTIDTIVDNVGLYKGSLADGDATDDTTPELQGTIDAPLATNEVVAIYRDGVYVGNATTNGSKWTYTDSGLVNGGDYVYTAKVLDKAGNTGPVSNDYEINIITNGPTTGTTITGINDDLAPVTGNVANNGFTNDIAPELQGTITATLKAGEVVAVYRDGVKVGEATVNGTSWSYTDGGLTDGEDYKYMARVEDAAQNAGGESNSYTINIDTTAPTQDVTIVKAIDNVDPISGDMTSGTVTNDDTPELQGTITSALGTGESVVIYRDGVEIGKATMTSSTTWSFTDASLSSGTSYEYTAYVKDAAGNLSDVSNEFDLTINTDGVNQTVQILYVQDDVDPVTGVVSNNGFTNDTTPVIEGSVSVALDAGDKVIVFRNGVEVGEATVNGTSWTFADTLANDGTYTYTALVENNAGDQGASSTAYKITLDTTPPDASKVVEITSITEDTGMSSSDFITNDTSLTVNGTVAIALASDEKIQISTDNGNTWADVSASGTTWSYVDGRTLTDGNYTYNVRVVDLAGNVGDTDSQVVRVDTTAPDASKAIEITSITDDTGLSSSDFITSDTTLTVNGTLASALASDERAQISIDGGKTWTDVSVSGTTWSYIDGRTLAEGDYTYDVRVVDLAGNVGDTDSQAVRVDTTAPDASKVVEITSITDDTGLNNSDFITDDRTLTVNGTLASTLASDERAQISIDGGKTWNDVGVSGTTWSYVDGRTLADGNYTYDVRVVDLAGNVGDTDSQVVSVGSANDAPVANVDVVNTDEDKVTIIDVLANDTDSDGDKLTVTQATVDSSKGTVVINSDGTITFTPVANYHGDAVINYSISDGKGGVSSSFVNVVVASVNDAPTDIVVTAINKVDEYAKAGTVVATMYTVDADLPNDSHIYTLSGKDADRFNIDANGTITVKADNSLYLGCPANAQDETFHVTVTTTDLAGASYSEVVDIKVTNIIEAPVKYCNPCSWKNLTVQGGDSNDHIVTGFGNDTVIACAGDDYISTNCGNDTIYAGSGNDKIYAGGNDDIIYTGLGADLVDGGCGTDTVSYIYSQSAVNVSLDGCKTGIGGDAEGDRLFCVENLIGSNFDDTLKDGCGANTIDGGKGNDNITGDCCDTLIGGEGNDKITVDSICFKSVDGGEGYDVLNYGACVSCLDLSNSYSPTVTNIEQINMKDGGLCRDTLVLNADGVDKITTDGVLMVTGDAKDQVKLESYGHYNDPSDWSKGQDTTVNGTNYSVYTSAGQTVMIENTVSVVFYNTLI